MSNPASLASDPSTDRPVALLQLGFRPFFIAAAGFGLLIMTVWFGLYLPGWPLPFYARVPVLTHAHEMVFGYAVAVIAGFLLTAIRNWTKIPTTRGVRLAALVLLWAVARVLALPGVEAPWAVIGLFDCAFLVALIVAITSPLVRARQWPQLAVVLVLLLLLASNVLFYGALIEGRPALAWWGVYCGIYLVLSLILLFVRRVLPSFIQNGVGYPVTLRNSGRVDAALLILFIAFAIADVFFDAPVTVAVLAAYLCLLHAWRLLGWHTRGIWRKPLLWVLYGGYTSIVIGFALKAAVPVLELPASLAVHAFTYGGIGVMTAGMMTRVALGHTGRNVHEPPAVLTWVFLLLLLGAAARVVLPLLLPTQYLIWVSVAQLAWVVAFALILITYAPMLVRARIDGQPG